MRTEHLQTVPGEIAMFQKLAAENAQGKPPVPATGLRASLSRFAVRIQDRLMTAITGLVDAVKSRF